MTGRLASRGPLPTRRSPACATDPLPVAQPRGTALCRRWRESPGSSFSPRTARRLPSTASSSSSLPESPFSSWPSWTARWIRCTASSRRKSTRWTSETPGRPAIPVVGRAFAAAAASVAGKRLLLRRCISLTELWRWRTEPRRKGRRTWIQCRGKARLGWPPGAFQASREDRVFPLASERFRSLASVHLWAYFSVTRLRMLRGKFSQASGELWHGLRVAPVTSVPRGALSARVGPADVMCWKHGSVYWFAT